MDQTETPALYSAPHAVLRLTTSAVRSSRASSKTRPRTPNLILPSLSSRPYHRGVVSPTAGWWSPEDPTPWSRAVESKTRH